MPSGSSAAACPKSGPATSACARWSSSKLARSISAEAFSTGVVALFSSAS